MNKPKMTLKEFFAEADRIGLTADVFAKQLAQRPEFADCVPPNAQQDASTDDDMLRVLWRSHGGSFHGPNVETGTMPERYLLPFLRSLINAPAQDAERERTAVQMLSAQLDHERAHNERLLKILVGIHNLTMPPLVESNGMRYQFTPPDAVEWLYSLTERIKAIPEEIDAARARRADKETS